MMEIELQEDARKNGGRSLRATDSNLILVVAARVALGPRVPEMRARTCWVVCMACMPREGSTSVVAIFAQEGAVSERMCIPRSRIPLDNLVFSFPGLLLLWTSKIDAKHGQKALRGCRLVSTRRREVVNG